MRCVPLAVLLFFVAGICASQAQDTRELVSLPAPMQEHMLGNMRDHLATLNEIIGDVANSKFDEAAKIAEQRLGMSSLSLHGAAHLAPYLPKPMQDIGTSMHHAASRLVIVLQDASITPTVDAMRDINRALHEVHAMQHIVCANCCEAADIRFGGHSLPIHLAPMRTNVRYASDSDLSLRSVRPSQV